MVNATEMAKAFNKRVPEWTRLQSAKEFLDHLWSLRNGYDPVVQKMHYDIEQVDDKGLNHILKSFDRDLHLIVTSNGGKLQGTWMHEDVALEFARWLSPTFAIWCNDRIKELLTTGSTSLDQNARNLNQELEEAKGRINYLTSRLDACQMELNYMKGRLEAEKELIALRATVEAEKRIAVLEYRLLQSERKSVRTKVSDTAHADMGKIPSQKPAQTKLFTDNIEQPDYAISCKLSKKEDLAERFPGAMLISEMCKRMRKEHGIYIKSGDIFVWLRRNGFLSSDKSEYNKPNAECMKNRWIVYRRPRGINERGCTYCTPYITPEGYTHFSRLILQKKGGLQ